MTLRELHNCMAVLRSIDGCELPWTPSTIEAFLRQPHDFFLRSDDQRQQLLWSIIERRLNPVTVTPVERPKLDAYDGGHGGSSRF